MTVVPISTMDPAALAEYWRQEALREKTRREQAELQAELNGQTVATLTAELRTLRGEKAHLTNSLRREQLSGDLRCALVEWFLRDADDLVFEVDGEAFLFFSVFEEPERFATLASKALVAALHGGDLPRRRCSTCKRAACNGCGGADTEPVIPARVRNLLEARRG